MSTNPRASWLRWAFLLCSVGVVATGCAKSANGIGSDAGGDGDLSVVENVDAGVPDLTPPPDLIIIDFSFPDLTVVCQWDAGQTVCGEFCIASTQCCTKADCPAPTNGAATCSVTNACGFVCDAGYKACGNKCIPSANCCIDGDCTTPTDPCTLAMGATCSSAGICTFPPVTCSLSGQSCSGGSCVCPSGQHPCANAGKCIPDGTCCTSTDCSAISGQVCASAGSNCSCLSGFKTCSASNSCILQTTCCDNGDCTGGTSCPGAGGSCNCPAGQRICGGVCIPAGNCCINADCGGGGRVCGGGACACPGGAPHFCSSVNICTAAGTCCDNSECPPGQNCSGIGGTCACAAGTKFCPAAGACIPNATCCTSSDCTNSQVCATAGGSCACPAGQKVCGTTCIPNANCCSVSDCPTAAHVTSATCNSGVCGVNCQGGWLNFDGAVSDGCECPDSGSNLSCGTAQGLGNFGLSASSSVTGQLPKAGQENWYWMNFTGESSTAYHPHVYFSANPGAEYVFDVYTSCGLALLTCAAEGGITALGKTSWEVLYANTPGGFGPIPIPAVGNAGQIFVRVRRKAPATLTCDSYTLFVRNDGS